MQLINTIYIGSFIAGVLVIVLIKFRENTLDPLKVFAAISFLILGLKAYTWWYLLKTEHPNYALALFSSNHIFPTLITNIFCLGVIILSEIKYPKDILLKIIAAVSIVYVIYDSLFLLIPFLLIPWGDLQLYSSISLAYGLFALFVTLFVALSLLVNVIRTKHHK